MNAVAIRIFDKNKTLRFDETLTTGSVYRVSVEGGADRCGSDAALILSTPGGVQAAVAALTDGAGVLNLDCDAMLKLEHTVPFGTTITLNAVLRSFDEGEEQNVAIGNCQVLAAWQGRENPDTGTVFYYKGAKGDPMRWGDMNESERDALVEALSAREDLVEAVAGQIQGADSVLDGVDIRTNTTNGMREAVKTIAQALGARSVRGIAAALGIFGFSATGAEVVTAPFGELDLDENPQVVTNVSFAGLATSEELFDAATAATNYADEAAFVASHIVTTNQTAATKTTNDVWLANWDKSIVFRPQHSDTTVWRNGEMEISWAENIWTLTNLPNGAMILVANTNTVISLNFGNLNGVRYTLTRKGSYDVVTNTLLQAANAYTDQQAQNALQIVSFMAEGLNTQIGSLHSEFIAASNSFDFAMNEASAYVDGQLQNVYQQATGYADALLYADAEVTAIAAAKGVSFTCAATNAAGRVCGENQNAALEIGRTARAKMDEATIERQPSNAVVRSVSIAIGEHADALVENARQSQALAIGWHAQAKASNAIAIGMGAEHAHENAMTGDATYACGGESIAVGYGAKATTNNAVQISKGVNPTPHSLQFENVPIVRDGSLVLPDIPEIAALSNRMERMVRPGNMTALADGRELEDDDCWVMQPRLDGLSELLIAPSTDGVYWAGTELAVEPPLGSRNYDLLVADLPEFCTKTSGVTVYLADVTHENAMYVCLGILAAERPVSAWCDPFLGFYNPTNYMITVTNAPFVVQLREPSTNRVYCAVKPWSMNELDFVKPSGYIEIEDDTPVIWRR